MSLVEVMVSMAVLVFGIMGALQGTLIASQQNAVAGRLARASSMAAQVRLGLELQGRSTLIATAGPIGSATYCKSPTTALKALTDGLAGSCILDVSAWDSATAAVGSKLTPNFDITNDGGTFKRMVVYNPTAGGADVFVVVVSIMDSGRRVFVKQTVALYDSSAATGNGTGVNL